MQKLPDVDANIDSANRILSILKKNGITKVNFVGGEPLLHPHLQDFVVCAKNHGLTVSIITNGYLLTQQRIKELKPFVDWIGISIDSANEDIEAKLGRGFGRHVENTLRVCEMIKMEGIKLKINTVVTKLNFSEDLRSLIERIHPLRWKVFQMLGILGQNETELASLAISSDEFQVFIKTNKNILLESNQSPTFETNDDMIDSYLMLAPDGSVIQNSGHGYAYHALEDVVIHGFSDILNSDKYVKRGGQYDW